MRFDLGERTFTVRGRSVTHRFMQFGAVVCVLARDEEGRVLLVRQYRAAPDVRTLELPAGWCEPGEAPAAAAVRELEEETGFRAGRVEELLRFWPSPGLSTEVIHGFAAYDLVATATHFDEGEDVELVRLTGEECAAAVRAGEIRDGKTLVVLMAARLGWRADAGG